MIQVICGTLVAYAFCEAFHINIPIWFWFLPLFAHFGAGAAAEVVVWIVGKKKEKGS
jgi:hypothetical protein